MNGGHDTFDIIQLRGAGQLDESRPLPTELVSLDLPTEAEASRTRQFELAGFSFINGVKVEIDRIDVAVQLGSTEIWEIRNDSNTHHNFHVHLVHFAVLDVDGQPPVHVPLPYPLARGSGDDGQFVIVDPDR